MTSKKAIYYYTLTGKTEAIINKNSLDKYKIYKLNDIAPNNFKFGDYNTIIIGSPTYGRGVPPKYFKEILGELYNLNDVKIGLFGSGNTIYGDNYCGALNILEEVLSIKNQIIFKYPFEGYPKEHDIINFTELINNL